MYTMKLIEYPNGTIQLRHYSRPMSGYNTESFTPHNNNSKKWEVEPFTGTKVRVVEEFQDSERSKKNSISHTKQQINTYARCYRWEWFCTFTYDGKKIDRYKFVISLFPGYIYLMS